jgi:hypothetical protein
LQVQLFITDYLLPGWPQSHHASGAFYNFPSN